MPRVRLGVALLLPAPFAAEVDGLRRAVGDGALGRMPAHLTLVPPVNVREDRLGEVLAVLRRAGAATRQFTVTLGPPTTFLPDSPTLYLAVTSTGRAEVLALRDRIFVDPLARPLTWPFEPHVTVADDAAPERIAAAVGALADYRVDATVERVHLLREGPGRIWTPIADAPFAAPAVIGRGGLPVELTVTDAVDPEARALDRPAGATPLVITARTQGVVAGYVDGWCGDGTGHVAALVLAPEQVALGVGRHLLAAFESEAAKRGGERITMAPALKGGRDVE
jgi:2'-5' RNA ligase